MFSLNVGTQALTQSVGVESPQQVQQQIMGSLQSLNIDAMLRHTFIPDYSVRAVTDVVYLVIKRSLHMAAKRATLMEKAQRAGEPCEINENDDEVEKVKFVFAYFLSKIYLCSFILAITFLGRGRFS